MNKIQSIDSNFSNLETLLFVDIDTQSLLHIKKGTVLKQYSISSSYYGTGSRENSLKTPLGRHEIYKKIGKGLPNNAILKGRVWNGAIADIIKELKKNSPITQIVVTHDISLALAIADTISILDEGVINLSDSPEIIKKTNHPLLDPIT